MNNSLKKAKRSLKGRIFSFLKRGSVWALYLEKKPQLGTIHVFRTSLSRKNDACPPLTRIKWLYNEIFALQWEAKRTGGVQCGYLNLSKKGIMEYIDCIKSTLSRSWSTLSRSWVHWVDHGAQWGDYGVHWVDHGVHWVDHGVHWVDHAWSTLGGSWSTLSGSLSTLSGSSRTLSRSWSK